MMTIRERALSVLNHRTPDVVPWLGDLAYWVTWLNRAELMPDKYKGDGLYRFTANWASGSISRATSRSKKSTTA